MQYIILVSIAIWLAGCGFDVASTAPDDTVQAEQIIDTVFINKIDTVSQITYWPCTTYVHDTSIVTYTDTIIETSYTTVRDTIRVNDTIQMIDTVTVIQYDTTIQTLLDTVYTELVDQTVPSPLDTLPLLLSGVQFDHIDFKLKANTLVFGYPDNYSMNGYATYYSLVIQTAAGVDTLKNQYVGKLSDRPTMLTVSPINHCVGILALKSSSSTSWLTGHSFKVCEDD